MPYSLDDFAGIPKPEQFVSTAIALGDLPTMDEVEKLAQWDKELLDIFEDDPTTHKFDRSMAMTHFAYSAAENGWTDEQMLVGLRDIDDRWEKYSKRTDRDSRFLIPMIDRARQKVGYDVADIDIHALIHGKARKDTADRIKVYGANEFAEADFHVDWLLEGLMPEGTLGMVTGYPGVGKTQLAIQIGCKLALGKEFLRWPNKAGRKKVLILSLEMGPHGLHVIWEPIMQGYDDQRELLDRNLKVYPIGEPVALDSKPGQRFMTDLMDEWKPDVVILDSLQKIISAEATDEASAKALMTYLSSLKARYGCSIILIHHNRKRPNETSKTKHVISLSDVFGSTYLTTDADFVLNIDKRGRDRDLKLLKARYGPDDTHFVVTHDEYLQFHDDLKDLRDNFDDDDDDYPIGPFGV